MTRQDNNSVLRTRYLKKWSDNRDRLLKKPAASANLVPIIFVRKMGRLPTKSRTMRWFGLLGQAVTLTFSKEKSGGRFDHRFGFSSLNRVLGDWRGGDTDTIIVFPSCRGTRTSAAGDTGLYTGDHDEFAAGRSYDDDTATVTALGR